MLPRAFALSKVAKPPLLVAKPPKGGGNCVMLPKGAFALSKVALRS
jgi:hypothetical protein